MNGYSLLKVDFAAAFVTLAACFVALVTTSHGQSSGTKSGVVVSEKPQTNTVKTIDLTTFDFKNHTYPDPAGTGSDAVFSLVNGVAKNGRITLRRIYFFEISDDSDDEAISMIVDSVCEAGCEPATRFFVHSAGATEPELVFKFASGAGFSCGLKAADFSVNEIAIETLGECELKNDWIAIPSTATKSGSDFTRFKFTRSGDGSWNAARESRRGVTVDLSDFRPKISFGGPQ